MTSAVPAVSRFEPVPKLAGRRFFGRWLHQFSRQRQPLPGAARRLRDRSVWLFSEPGRLLVAFEVDANGQPTSRSANRRTAGRAGSPLQSYRTGPKRFNQSVLPCHHVRCRAGLHFLLRPPLHRIAGPNRARSHGDSQTGQHGLVPRYPPGRFDVLLELSFLPKKFADAFDDHFFGDYRTALGGKTHVHALRMKELPCERAGPAGRRGAVVVVMALKCLFGVALIAATCVASCGGSAVDSVGP